ncbi:transglutaminase-like cysteine peptidase [Thiomicrorhabdus sp.]|uniref:transglutaminase-like cysteine peptidase n=1 Tax=Thiomicrorhabdus sp. TaxID=2039724 RepID=UPI0029C82811|nr:transglutaminase-like cysteine peptidase [Thiomicrorhabdus sp.]
MLQLKKNRSFFGALTMILLGSQILSSCSSYREERKPNLISDEVIRDSEKTYGYFAPKRLQTWNNVIQRAAKLSEGEKVIFVNREFNEVPYSSDFALWRKEDYWATPFEFLAKDAGDCEDYSIAKYTALRNLNIPVRSLNLAYVRKLPSMEPHMVLLYTPENGGSPLVLDNEIKVAFPLKKRTDLMVIYKFNETNGYLVNGQKNTSGKNFDAKTIQRWKLYLERPGIYTLLNEEKEESKDSGFFGLF